VREFQALPEALALAAANKRIGNILKKAERCCPNPTSPCSRKTPRKPSSSVSLLIAPLVRSHVANEDYADALKVLASVRSEVDRFFDEVMVNVDEPLLRGNRLGLLKALFDQLNAVADISRLAV
jgi:glycyl-tRNA synthetase beta chain